MVKNKIIPITTFLLVLVALFGVLSVPTSAYVGMYEFDYSTAYYQPLPYDVSWQRSNGNTYHYNAIQNILNAHYDVYSDTNLYYTITRENVDYTPYSEFNPFDTEVVLYEGFYRYANSTGDIGGTLSLLPIAIDGFEWFRLLPFLTIYNSVGSSATVYLNAYILYTYYDGDSLVYDEFSFTHNDGDLANTGQYDFSSTLDVYSFDFYTILNELMPDVDYETLYICEFDVTAYPYYHGFGVVNYLAYSQDYRYSSAQLTKPSYIPPRQDISGYVGQYMNDFARLFAIEVLPGIAIYNILSLALVIPVGLALIRRI